MTAEEVQPQIEEPAAKDGLPSGQTQPKPFDEKDIQILNLEGKVAELEQQIANQRLEVAASSAKKAAPDKLSTMQQDFSRTRLIKAVGNSRYHALPLNERLAALGQAPASESELNEIGMYFGPKSSGVRASELAKTSPAKYARLRAIAKETGTF